MDELTIWHNPRCSKSREALALLESRGFEPNIVRYLETPPSREEIERVLALLGVEPRALMRTKESLYGELGLARPELTREALVEAMVEHPSLIERPVVVLGDRAVIGRPPELVLSLV